MNRLTERGKSGIAYTKIPLNNSTALDENENIIECYTGFIAEKLAEYEDLEEQGLLIKLPCKIGQDLYIVSNRVDGKGHVRRLTLTHNNLGNVLKRLDDDIFKTREEAEKSLEVSNGE